jgi:hypothetical protein
MVWTYGDILSKVRATTGRPDTSMMSNATILDYVNKYYQFVLPKELKIFFGYTYYEFFTEEGEDQYTPSTDFQTFNPQVYVDGFPSDWYLSPDLFYQDYPQQANKFVVATGNGILNSFPFQNPTFPILPRSFYVTDGPQTVQGDGVGNLTGAGTGSVDYSTGVVSSLSFTNPPAANASITATSQSYVANRPQGILYYNNVFLLRPVPDDVYLVRMEGIRIPTAFTGSLTQQPFRPDLGPLIAYGASLEIFADFNQMDQYEQTLVQYNRYKDVSMQDTYEEYLYERAIAKF